MLLSAAEPAALRGRLIVSVQAYPGEPMRAAQTMAQVAASAELEGAAAVRVQVVADSSRARPSSSGDRPVQGRL